MNSTYSKPHSNAIRRSTGDKAFMAAAMIIIALISLACLIPFVMVLSGSFSAESAVIIGGYSLLPKEPTLAAYRAVFSLGSSIPRAYGVTILVTLLGTLLGLLTVSMSGFVLSRPDFKRRNAFAFFIYFTTLFSGGMIPAYLVNTQILGLKNTVWALILPAVMSPFNIFLFRNFIRSIPNEMVESAHIDGAGTFRIYLQIILPLAKPAVATIGLFMALGYWNDWYRCSLYITDKNLYVLQYLLYRMLSRITDAVKEANIVIDNMPGETMKLATAMLATGPVLLFYPFAQKYFVGGLVVGGVKG